MFTGRLTLDEAGNYYASRAPGALWYDPMWWGVATILENLFTFWQKIMATLMILVAGPYRGGTNDDPVMIEANVQRMTATALALYKMGHLPVMGEWFALPLIHAAGSKAMGDDVWNGLFHPVAMRLIEHCDGVLRIGGPSAGADQMIETGKACGKRIFYSMDEIPAP